MRLIFTKSNRAIKSTFEYQNTSVSISPEMIRVFVMVSADGCIRKNNNNDLQRIELHLKKERKIQRAKLLLENANLMFSEKKAKDGSVFIYFSCNKKISKSLQLFYKASKEQLAILIDEVYHWDSTVDVKRSHKMFSTTNKINADVIQFALAANGIRAGMSMINENWATCYNVYETKNEYVGFPNRKFEMKKSKDGFKYCFTTSTGFFVIRRNNKISITGNCGMLTIQLPKELNDLSLSKLDEFINTKIPSGFNINDKRLYNPTHEGLYINKLKCYNSLKNVQQLEKAVGSLGSGNHFIELDIDENGNKYLVIHTGSRNLGKQVAEFYQKIADEDCNLSQSKRKQELDTLIINLKNEKRYSEINSEIDKFNREYQSEIKMHKDLCYLEGEHMDDYLHDMFICQHFAQVNRKYIALGILEHLFKEKYNNGLGNVWMDIDSDCGYEDDKIDIRMDMFETVHNYINPKDHILRKGAISANEKEKVLIPINMRDGAIIGIGKGNAEYNYSGPHGAGRLMSRSQAKKSVSLEEFQKSMKGIYSSSVGTSTIDESPMAYKPIESIIENIKESIDIVKIIKPIYNFKAH